MELIETMTFKLLASKAPLVALFGLVFLLPWFLSKVAYSNEIVIPKPVAPVRGLEAESVELTIDIVDQRAKVHLRQTVKNTGRGNLELDFLVPLPSNAAISGLALVANGQELTGQIYGKDEAFGIYQEIVAKLKDPALLEFVGQGLFRARVYPVAGGQSASLDLTFNYLLPKDNGRVDLDFPLANSLTKGLNVGSQIVTVTIKGQKLGGVFSLQEGVQITKTGEAAKAELSLKNSMALNKFQLYYQDEAGPMGGLILSHKPKKDQDGFFLFMAEPVEVKRDQEALPKNVIFALDTSGSMAGQKFKQAQEALKFVLDRLAPEDRFNLITFAEKVASWRPELAPMNKKNRDDAKNYVDGLYARGGTNIEGALKESLSLNIGEYPTYLIFLTDGQPTVGEEDDVSLAQLAAKENQGQGVRIFSFGIGFDVNARLLERLSGGSSGYSTYVSQDESIEDKVSSFYAKVSDPMLVNPELKTSRKVNRLQPEKLPDIFHGSQLVVVGRYRQGGKVNFTLTGTQGNDTLVSNYPAVFANAPTDNGHQIAIIWAERRVAQIINEIDLKGQARADSDQLNELLELSKEFGIMTPYTSFLALEDQNLSDNEANFYRTQSNLSQLEAVTGESAVAQRQYRSEMLAPKPLYKMAPQSIDLHSMQLVDREITPASKLIPPTMIDGQAYFLKDGRLMPGDVSEEDLKNLIVVKRFSPEYFELVKSQTPGQMPLFTQSVPLVCKINDKTYLIDIE